MKRKILFILLVICYLTVFSQRRPPNLPYFDDMAVHWGWYIGYNQLYTNMVSKHNLPYMDTIMSFNANSGMGFQIGLLGDARLLSFLHVRLLPCVMFSDRNFDYLVKHSSSLRTTHNSLEVIYIEVPLEFKMMAKRWHDFRPYLIAGAKYAYDAASIRRKKLYADEYLFKINEHEMFYTLGAGFNFYLPYFVMAIEIKGSFGLTDVLNHNYHTVYSEPVDKCKTQVFYINLIFED